MEWISVKESLPTEDARYLICAGAYIGIGWYDPEYGWSGLWADYVTHWMELPERPE
jgi:hypothetical protein